MSINVKKMTILLTGGRAPATLELARLIHDAGHRVIVADSIPTPVSRYSNAVSRMVLLPAPRTHRKQFLSTLEKVIQEEQVDILIPTCEEVFTVASGLAKLSPLCHVWTEPLSVLNQLHNKWLFIQTAKQLGFRVPETFQVESIEELKFYLQQHGEESKWVIKPVYSRFASKMFFVTDVNDPLPDIPISKQEPWLVQEWIEGSQICTYSLANQGMMTAHTAYRTTFTAGIGSSICFRHSHHNHLQKEVEKWIHHFSFTGQIAFDWIETPSGELVPIECNPRLTSGIHLFSPEDRIDYAFDPTYEGKTVIPQQDRRQMLALAMYSYGLSSIRSFVQFKNWLRTVCSSQDVLFRWKDPLPSWGQLSTLFYFWKQTRKLGISMLESSTYDIEWNGDE
ncbi:ATP-grasp domain-containing protein [Hazenella coriacea]|uniref:Carbamoylphosphate synthase large subunit n=1 Tax=Hazenella coriacea TaxID=1179467 RepID=A0A4R3LH63_9BACL|nr:ATP-grasp domain-containing protein [Hazenella coriacea]TCS96856.1 carbamoylphosphate synthase large subunit [Hazenella coriacea]